MRIFIALAILLLAVLPRPATADEVDALFANLPDGWRVTQKADVPQTQAAAIGRRLGGRITRLINATIARGGQPLRVNAILCPAEADALAIHASLAKMKGNPAYCARRGQLVVEFVSDDFPLVVAARYALGLQPKEVSYRVRFRMAAVAKADYMAANRLSNTLIALRKDPGNTEQLAAAAELKKRFTFGDTLRLRAAGKVASYELSPAPVASDASADGAVTTYRFADLPTFQGVPEVAVTATIRCVAFAPLPTARPPDATLTAATAFWPADDPELRELAAKITEGAKTDRQKLDALLKWIFPGRNLKFSGAVVGSRYGVKQVLKQGHGHCWDFSDCFVTLARAAGLPCRQAAGWLAGVSGHVWAEVFCTGLGWLQVDPTAGTACGSDYIPWLTTADGEMPIVYTQWPQIEVVERAAESPAAP